jgi:hypothetical protein
MILDARLSLLVCLCFLHHLSAAAPLCENDETSLVQVQTLVKRGSDLKQDRIPNEMASVPTPMDDYAILDDLGKGDYSRWTTPDVSDKGEVGEAFGSNVIKTKDEVEAKAASSIDFANSQQEERKASRENASAAITAAKEKAIVEIAKQKKALDKVLAQRLKVIDAAENRAADAKENAEAHDIKAAQAESAAVLGREVGALEGRDAAAHAWGDYYRNLKEGRRKEVLQIARDRVARNERLRELAANGTTNVLAGEDAATANAVGRMATAAMAEADAGASDMEQIIEGPDIMNNHMD